MTAEDGAGCPVWCTRPDGHHPAWLHGCDVAPMVSIEMRDDGDEPPAIGVGDDYVTAAGARAHAWALIAAAEKLDEIQRDS